MSFERFYVLTYSRGMSHESTSDLARRVAALEEAVGRLTEQPPPTTTDHEPRDSFWALHGLQERGIEGVVMAGSVVVPEAGPVAWQTALTTEALLDLDWSELAPTIDALSHPARLTILRLVLSGVRTTSALLEQESLGTTGQLHHHLRQLVAAGWLTLVKRGQYLVPGPRVVPLLVVMLAATR